MQEIKLYSTNYCPYCQQAKRLLTQQNLKFEEISLEGQDDLRRQLSEDNGGWRTVPMIFIGDEFIGGFDDLHALQKSGELLAKVNA
jgi:glutaredoxin 3